MRPGPVVHRARATDGRSVTRACDILCRIRAGIQYSQPRTPLNISSGGHVPNQRTLLLFGCAVFKLLHQVITPASAIPIEFTNTTYAFIKWIIPHDPGSSQRFDDIFFLRFNPLGV